MELSFFLNIQTNKPVSNINYNYQIYRTLSYLVLKKQKEK